MKIKLGQVEFYSQWLLKHLTLIGKSNRMRMKFISVLSLKAEELRKYHLQLLQEHCNLDEGGNPKVAYDDDSDKGHYEVIDRIAYEHELMVLLSEEFVIEESEENREMLCSIKESVENCPIPWSGDEAIEYEHVCKLFDVVNAE